MLFNFLSVQIVPQVGLLVIAIRSERVRVPFVLGICQAH